MSRQKSRGRSSSAPALPFDTARDEMFQHVMRCGVIGSAPEHQTEWFDETMKFLADRYHELSKNQVAELRVLGERFAAPTATPEGIAPAQPVLAQSTEASTTESDDEPTGEEAKAELDTVNAA